MVQIFKGYEILPNKFSKQIKIVESHDLLSNRFISL